MKDMMHTKPNGQELQAIAYDGDGKLTTQESVLLLGAFLALAVSMVSFITLWP